MRLWFWIDSFLVFVTGIQLFVLSEFTDRFFAWTIMPPLTAAFLGAAYWASFPLVLLSARQTTWHRARIAVYGVLAFTTLTLVATVLHLDRFHLHSPDPLAVIAAWAWLVVYVSVPPALLVLLILQLRRPGDEPPRALPLPPALRLLLGVQAVGLLITGIVLFLAPQTPIWPWALTPLTGRAVGAWLVGIGLIAAHAGWENDFVRLRAAFIAYTLLGALQLVAVARYPGTVVWDGAPIFVYLVVVASFLAVGLYGLLTQRARAIAPGQVQP